MIFLALLLAVAGLAQTVPNAVRPLPAQIQFADANGVPLAGGKLYTYAAGTTTPQATYTDSSAGTPNTNPILLDAGGRAHVWIGTNAYKFVVEDRNGVVRWTEDNILDTALNFVNNVKTIGTCTLITYTNPRSGGAQRTCSNRLAEEVYVGDFGSACTSATLNLAIASLSGAPGVVKTIQGQPCTLATTVTIPAQYLVLDCQGSIMNYTPAAGDAFLISAFASDVPYDSGGMRNCRVNSANGSPGVSTGIHQQSRLGFHYDRVTVKGFNGSMGTCMFWENTATGPMFTEQTTIDGLDTEDCSEHLKLANTAGTNSFAYNYIANWHCGLNDGQKCLSLDGNGTPNNILMFGSFLDIRVNANGSSDMRVISATGGSIVERKMVNLTGELTSGAGPLYSMYVDTSSELNVTGNVNIAGARTFSAGSQSFTAVLPAVDPVTGAVIFRAGGNIQPQRKCLYALGYPDATPTNGGNAQFWIASNGGTENNCVFQILKRNTDSTNVDVNVPGSGSSPVNILYTDSNGFLGIGPEWSESSRPAFHLDLLGSTFRLPNKIVSGNSAGFHQDFVNANSDESFSVLISAASSTATFNFTTPYNHPPTCVATPNRALVSFGANWIQAGWAIAPSVSGVVLTQFAMDRTGASTTLPFEVTYFVHCRSNPD